MNIPSPSMNLLKHSVLLFVLCLGHSVSANLDDGFEENGNDIEELQRLLEETVKVDLKLITEKFDKLVDHINSAIKGLGKYTEDSVKELEDHLKKSIQGNDKKLVENLKKVSENGKKMIEDANKMLQGNLKDVKENSLKERKENLWWAHHRFHLHEDILKTRITICAYDHGHLGKGVVTYDGKDGGYVENSVSIRVFNKTEPKDLKKEDILNLGTGAFTVPENAAGEYLFTFSVVMDTYDQKRMPSEYFFRVDGETVPGARIYTDGGRSATSDRIPGTFTILLKLDAGQTVDVEQTRNTDISDYEISFCVALLHLDVVRQMRCT